MSEIVIIQMIVFTEYIYFDDFYQVRGSQILLVKFTILIAYFFLEFRVTFFRVIRYMPFLSPLV